MEISEFVTVVQGFDQLSDREKIRLFAWHLHSHCDIAIFSTGDIRKCFEDLRLVPPNISQHLSRMSATSPPGVIKSKGKYKLHRRHMVELDGLYVSHPTTVATSRLLSDLPVKIPDGGERAFLAEAISCYQVKAYRASIVMAWNLAYDHLMRWIFLDSTRVVALNAAFSKRFQKNPPAILTLQDFEDIKEFDVVEACGTAGLLASNVVRILKEKLVKRNMAAHPSAVIITESQANDVITDLINNVVMALV